MNDFNSFNFQIAMAQDQRASDSWENRNQTIVKQAVRLYERVYRHGRMARLLAWLRRRPYQLLNLTMVKQQCQISNQYHLGLQTAQLNQIRGSADRSHDFDLDFHPRQNHSRQRWVSVAMVWLAGEPLPPVELIQVGNIYFVEDGHHRISVAKAMGQLEIDAEVKAWQVKGALPWDPVRQELWMGNEMPSLSSGSRS